MTSSKQRATNSVPHVFEEALLKPEGSFIEGVWAADRKGQTRGQQPRVGGGVTVAGRVMSHSGQNLDGHADFLYAHRGGRTRTGLRVRGGGR